MCRVLAARCSRSMGTFLGRRAILCGDSSLRGGGLGPESPLDSRSGLYPPSATGGLQGVRTDRCATAGGLVACRRACDAPSLALVPLLLAAALRHGAWDLGASSSASWALLARRRINLDQAVPRVSQALSIAVPSGSWKQTVAWAGRLALAEALGIARAARHPCAPCAQWINRLSMVKRLAE